MEHVAQLGSLTPAERPLERPQRAVAVVERGSVSAVPKKQVLKAYRSPPKVAQQVLNPLFVAQRLRAQVQQQQEQEGEELSRQLQSRPKVCPEQVQAVRARQAQRNRGPVPPSQPSSPEEWVQVMCGVAHELSGKRGFPHQHAQLRALQTQVTQRLVQAFKRDPRPLAERLDGYIDLLLPLHRFPLSNAVAQMVLRQLPQRDQALVQARFTLSVQRQVADEYQDQQLLETWALQEQWQALQEAQHQPLMKRLEARRGLGRPLPARLRRALELSWNVDLRDIRIHTDVAAHQFCLKLNALAFIAGQREIFFRQGMFDPHAPKKRAIIAHEVAHALTPVSAGLHREGPEEDQAQRLGQAFAQRDWQRDWPRSSKPASATPPPLPAPTPHALQTFTVGAQLPTLSPRARLLAEGQEPASAVGFVWHRDGAVNLRLSPGGLVVGSLPRGKRVQLVSFHPGHQAYALRYAQGALWSGLLWAAASHIKVAPAELLDEGLELYVPSAGETVSGLAQRRYLVHEYGRDARFYGEVLRKANPRTPLQPDGSLQLRPGVPIWLPSQGKALQLQEQTVSRSKPLYDWTEQALGSAGVNTLRVTGALAGYLVGIVGSLWENLTGLFSLISGLLGGLWSTVVLLLKGQLLNKLRTLLTGVQRVAIAFLLEGGAALLYQQLRRQFLAQWNHPNPLQAAYFQGKVMGYALTELLLLFVAPVTLLAKLGRGPRFMTFSQRLIRGLFTKVPGLAQAAERAKALAQNTKVSYPPPALAPTAQTSTGHTGPVQQELSLAQLWQKLFSKTKDGPDGLDDASKAHSGGRSSKRQEEYVPGLSQATGQSDEVGGFKFENTYGGTIKDEMTDLINKSDLQMDRAAKIKLLALLDEAELGWNDKVKGKIGDILGEMEDIAWAEKFRALTRKAESHWNNYIDTDIVYKSGGVMNNGRFSLEFDPAGQNLIFKNFYRGKLPAWIPEATVRLDPEQGVPTTIYTVLYQLNKLGVPEGSLRSATIAAVKHPESLLKFTYLKRQGLNDVEALKQILAFQYVEDILKQHGHQVVGIELRNTHDFAFAGKIIQDADDGPGSLDNLKALMKAYNLKSDSKIEKNFFAHLQLAPLSKRGAGPVIQSSLPPVAQKAMGKTPQRRKATPVRRHIPGLSEYAGSHSEIGKFSFNTKIDYDNYIGKEMMRAICVSVPDTGYKLMLMKTIGRTTNEGWTPEIKGQLIGHLNELKNALPDDVADKMNKLIKKADKEWTIDARTNLLYSKGNKLLEGSFESHFNPRERGIAFLDLRNGGVPSWIPKTDTELVKGKGIPASVYALLKQLNDLKIKKGSLLKAMINTVEERESVLKLAYLRKKGLQDADIARELPIFKFIETVLIQHGHQVKRVKIVDRGRRKKVRELLDLEGISIAEAIAERKRLGDLYKLDPNEEIMYDFDVLLDLIPLLPGQVSVY